MRDRRGRDKVGQNKSEENKGWTKWGLKVRGEKRVDRGYGK